MSTPLPTLPKPEYGLAHHVYGKQRPCTSTKASLAVVNPP